MTHEKAMELAREIARDHEFGSRMHRIAAAIIKVHNDAINDAACEVDTEAFTWIEHTRYAVQSAAQAVRKLIIKEPTNG